MIPRFYTAALGRMFGLFDDTILDDEIANGFRAGYVGYTGNSYALIALVASQKLPSNMTHFEIRGTSLPDLLGQQGLMRNAGQLGHSISGLRSLELHGGTVAPFDTPMTLNLQLLLMHAVNLERLVVSFRSGFSRLEVSKDMLNLEMGLYLLSIFRSESGLSLPARLTWSRTLKHLDLNHLVCTSAELKQVLGAADCGRSLEELRLSRIVLLPAEEGGSRACFVDILKWMQRNLRLQIACFNGSWSNGGMQNWYIYPQHGVVLEDGEQSQSLRDLVQLFVIAGGPCPLEHVQIPTRFYDLAKPDYSPTVPEVLKDPKYRGDPSWSMQYLDENIEEPAYEVVSMGHVLQEDLTQFDENSNPEYIDLDDLEYIDWYDGPLPNDHDMDLGEHGV